MTETYYIYFAGDLFNHKDLIGNLLLQANDMSITGEYQDNNSGKKTQGAHFLKGF